MTTKGDEVVVQNLFQVVNLADIDLTLKGKVDLARAEKFESLAKDDLKDGEALVTQMLSILSTLSTRLSL